MLWGLRTTPNRSTGYTPFFMVYSAEAVLPCDLIHGAPRVHMHEEKEAELDRQDDLDALEGERDVARARLRKQSATSTALPKSRSSGIDIQCGRSRPAPPGEAEAQAFT